MAPRGGSNGLGDENMGGGGMGPISVTPIGCSDGSGCCCAPPAPVEDSTDDERTVEALEGGDRFGVCAPIVMLEVVEVGVADETEMMGTVAALPAILEGTEGDAVPKWERGREEGTGRGGREGEDEKE